MNARQTAPCPCIGDFDCADPDCRVCAGTGHAPICRCGALLELQVERQDGMCASCWCERRDATIAELTVHVSRASLGNDNTRAA